MVKYAKLTKDSQLYYAPPVYHTPTGSYILNFDKDFSMIVKYGFKEVIDIEPEYDPGTQYLDIVSFTETDEHIVINYEVLEQPTDTPTVFQRVTILEENHKKVDNKFSLIDGNIKQINDDILLASESAKKANDSLFKTNNDLKEINNCALKSKNDIEEINTGQENQDIQIVQNMMGMAELCEMVLDLQDKPMLPIEPGTPEATPQSFKHKNSMMGGESAMVDIYANLVLLGKYTLEPIEAVDGVKLVPMYYREKVRLKLDEWSK